VAKRLVEKVAIVTGASRGLGQAISLGLAEEGATVVLAARNLAKLKEVAEQVKALGAKAEVVITDLADERAIKNVVEVTGEKCGRLDILVNNAGVTHSAKLEDTTTSDWDRVLAVNVRGPFMLCREALPLLKQSNRAPSKHALRGMTKSLAEELRGSNVRVHSICPGGIDTDMIGSVRPDIKKEDLMRPQELAELVVYLVTHKGNAVIDELHIRRASSPPWF
jgi:3-oxoacyl-[acyl-carrier protein] reductase